MPSCKNNKKEQGQSVVEFALLLPILLFIVMFAIEISMGAYYKMILNQIMLDVARIVAVSDNQTSSELNADVQAILTAYQNQGALHIRATDTSLFSITWSTETVDILYKIITVTGRYTGVQLPFIGTLPVSDQLVYPFLDHGSGI